MRVGEVCLLTQDVVRLADFYKALLELENDSWDPVHQTLIGEETMLTILRDDSAAGQNVALAFTVDDVGAAFRKVQELGAEIVEGPAKRPWGAVNMCFRDPDGRKVFFRSFSTAVS